MDVVPVKHGEMDSHYCLDKCAMSLKNLANSLHAGKSFTTFCCQTIPPFPQEKINILKDSLRNTTTVSNSLYPDHFVSPYLGPNCL